MLSTLSTIERGHVCSYANSGAAFLIRDQSRYPIHLFPFLYSDRLTLQMGNCVLMIWRVVLNYLLLHLDDGVLYVRVRIRAKLMEHISGRPTMDTEPRLPPMPATSLSDLEVSETDEREGQQKSTFEHHMGCHIIPLECTGLPHGSR